MKFKYAAKVKNHFLFAIKKKSGNHFHLFRQVELTEPQLKIKNELFPKEIISLKVLLM